MLDKINSALKNPLITAISSILITIVFGYLFYYLALNKTELSYSVSPEEVITPKTEETSSLSYWWGADKINSDIKRIKIAIYNDGNTFIDNSKISSDNPIKIIIPPGTYKILGQNITKISQKGLKITTDMAENSSVIKVTILNDDGFEENNGLIVSLFYTGDNTPNPIVTGRIKGSRDITEKNWSDIHRVNTGDLWIYLMVIFVLFISGALLLITTNEKLKDSKLLKYLIYDFSGNIVGGLLMALGITFILSTLTPYIHNLSWIN